MKRVCSFIAVLLVGSLICGPRVFAGASTTDSQPIDNGKGRLVIAYESVSTRVTVRKVADDFLIGVGVTGIPRDKRLSILSDLRSRGFNHFLPWMAWGKGEPTLHTFSSSDFEPGNTTTSYLDRSRATLTGHCMLFLLDQYGTVPPWAFGLTFEQQKSEIQKYVSYVVSAHPEVDMWDLNEPVCQNALHWSREQVYDVFVCASRWIHEASRTAKVLINMIPIENDWSSLHYDPIEVLDDLLERGLEADVIGIEYYQGFAEPEERDPNGYPSMSVISSKVDLFRKYNKPIILSEVGVPGIVNGNRQYEKQADWAESLFRFCHDDKDIIGATWYFILDDVYFDDGMEDNDLSYRPVADRLFELADEWNPVASFDWKAKSYVDLEPGDYDVMTTRLQNSVETYNAARVTILAGQTTIFADEIPPSISITSPPSSPWVTHSGNILIEGTVMDMDSGVAELTLDNKAVPVGGDGSFETHATLSEGYNSIVLLARDNSGNYWEKTLDVTYAPEVMISLRVGQNVFAVNGASRTLDSPATIKNGRTLVPIRAIIEALGGTVGWDGATRKATVELGSTSLELWIGKNSATVNGTTTLIDATNAKVVPEIINGRTMLPLRFVTENLGATVSWDQSTQTIAITYQP